MGLGTPGHPWPLHPMVMVLCKEAEEADTGLSAGSPVIAPTQPPGTPGQVSTGPSRHPLGSRK